jgi:uncharacterized protein GlcG (DUF336 family)
MITLGDANSLIELSFKRAGELSLKPIAVAVFDTGGHLVAAQRQDGASTGRLQIATGKAKGSLFMGMSSRAVGDMASQRPTFVASLGSMEPSGIVPAPGGLLVSDEHGRLIGAIGISGDTSDNDEACATDAIKAAGLFVSP